MNALAGRDPEKLEALIDVGKRYDAGHASELEVFCALSAFLGEGSD